MTSKKSLWGELPKFETIRTPYTILKEQASILSEITKGLLIGEVKRSQEVQVSTKVALSKPGTYPEFVAFLTIKAPSLNNYTYSVVKVQYPMLLYPVLIESLAVDNLLRECSSEAEFENTLGQILSSQEVKRVISGLLAQIHADIPKQVIDAQ
jgi:hypothetical protein